MSPHVLAIDPASGKSNSALGWVVRYRQDIVLAGLVVRAPTETLTAYAERAALEIALETPGDTRLLIETMKILSVTKSLGDPQDLMDVQTVGAFVTGALRAHGSVTSDVRFVPAQEWKGSVPGDIMTERLWSALTPDEQAVVMHATKRVRPKARKPDHNAIDAAGLAMWDCGRVNRR